MRICSKLFFKPENQLQYFFPKKLFISILQVSLLKGFVFHDKSKIIMAKVWKAGTKTGKSAMGLNCNIVTAILLCGPDWNIRC